MRKVSGFAHTVGKKETPTKKGVRSAAMSKIRGEPTLHDWVYENLSRSECPDEDSSLAVKDHYKEVLACPICGEKPMIFWSDGEYLARGNNACCHEIWHFAEMETDMPLNASKTEGEERAQWNEAVTRFTLASQAQAA